MGLFEERGGRAVEHHFQFTTIAPSTGIPPPTKSSSGLSLFVAKQSQKFCPEAIIFLRTLLMAATQNKAALDSESQFYHLMELKALRPLLCVQECINEISPLNFRMVMDMAEDSSFFWSDNFRDVDRTHGFLEFWILDLCFYLSLFTYS